MAVQKFEFLQSLAERLQGTAQVNAVFGEPVQVGEKTVIPVARVAYGLGGGYGKAQPGGAEGVLPESGGGGIRVAPAGVLEVTREQTRFIPFPDNQVPLAGGAFMLGIMLGRWRRGSVVR